VISARNLPVMKKLHNTADPFVEVDIVSAYTTALDAHVAISESQTLPRTSVQVIVMIKSKVAWSEGSGLVSSMLCFTGMKWLLKRVCACH
jgi:hypothetical protein